MASPIAADHDIFHYADVFRYLSKSVDLFCRNRGISILPWYHDEPRWLLRWGEEPLRQIELRVEGNPVVGHVEVVLMPSIFDGKEWHFGDSRFLTVNKAPRGEWYSVDARNAVDLDDFEQDLEETYQEANSLPVDALEVAASQQNRRQARASTYAEIENALPRSVASDIVGPGRKGKASLNSQWHNHDTLRTVNELDELQHDPPLREWFYHSPERSPRLDPAQFGRLISPYVDLDPTTGQLRGFRLSVGERPTICGLDAALRVMAYHVDFAGFEHERAIPITKEGRRPAKRLTMEELDAGAAAFVEKCRTNHLVSSSVGRKGTISTTAAAFEIARSLKSTRLFGVQSKYERLLSSWKNAISEAIYEHFGPELVSNGRAAFRNETREHQCISASYYAFRILGSLGVPKEVDNQPIVHFLAQPRKKAFLEFIRLCWSPSEGGFSSEPFGKADVLHTRYALQVIRTLLNSRAITKQELEWLNPPAIMDYILSCYSDGGFAVRPGFVPLLNTSRLAVNSIKLLEIFRLHNCFGASRNYLDRRAQFESVARNIIDFTRSCQNDTEYYDFPV